MLNKDIKTRFLTTEYTNEETIKCIWYIFEKIGMLEEQYNIDLYNFNMNQLQDVLRLLDCVSINALGKNWSIIDRYIQWATGEGYCLPNLAAMNIFRKDLEQFINKDASKNQYIKDKNEYYQMLNEIYNPQDQVILVLLYEGVRGRNVQPYSFEEIQNLKAIDVNYENKTLKLTRDNGRGRIADNIDDKSLEVIYNAVNENLYYKGNGNTTARVKTYNIIESEYVVRQVERSDNTERIGIMTINGRIQKIKKWTGKYYLNAKSIFYSGMFHRLQNIEKERDLTEKDYSDICVRYGMFEHINTWRNIKDKYLKFKQNI